MIAVAAVILAAIAAEVISCLNAREVANDIADNESRKDDQ